MTEQFLQYLWKYRLLNPDLQTVRGEKVVVLHPGMQNTDGGPDFFNARLRMGNTIWAGNVEVHLRASDWIRHRHQFDPAYENVILHVVYEHDQDIRMKQKGSMPTLVMKNNFPSAIEQTYEQIMHNHQWIPCSGLQGSNRMPVFRLWAPALATERLNAKSDFVLQLLDEYADWDEVFYIFLACGFGFRINSMPFELLARSVPLRIVRRNADSLFRLEALFYGQSGLIGQKSGDAYRSKLMAEYLHQQVKYNLKPLKPGLWKRLRLHPFNFPDIRISQFVECLHACGAEPGFLYQSADKARIEECLQPQASDYWKTHFRFGRSSGRMPKRMGLSSARLLIINTIAPFLFAYGSARDVSPYRIRALELLEGTEPEDNHELRKWNDLGLKAADALESQALIQLKRTYCDRRRCLECRIGLKLLDKNTLP